MATRAVWYLSPFFLSRTISRMSEWMDKYVIEPLFLDTKLVQLILSVAGTYVVLSIKKVREYIVNFLQKVLAKKKHYVNIHTIKNFDEIHKEVFKLRELLQADRCAVCQFHNGDEFTLSNPIFKLTCAYEDVENGLTFDSRNIHYDVVSHMIDFIGPLMDPDKESPGVTECRYCAKYHNDSACGVRKNPFRILSYDLENMRHTYFKYQMMEQGNKHSYATLLYDKSLKNPIGVVCIQYIDDDIESHNELLREKICEVADSVARIQFMLASAS